MPRNQMRSSPENRRREWRIDRNGKTKRADKKSPYNSLSRITYSSKHARGERQTSPRQKRKRRVRADMGSILSPPSAPHRLKYIERKIEEMQKKDEQVRRNMSRKNAEHPPPGGDLSGTVDKLDAETLETKMMLLPFVDNLEFIDIHIESRSNPKRLDFESFSTFDASALSQNFGDESCTDSTRREILGDAVVGKEEEEEEEGGGQKEKGIAAESFGASISSAINHAIVLSRGRYVTFCGKLERLKGIVCTSNISTNRPLMWVMTLLSDVWIFRAVQESRASRVCVAMPQSLLSCFTSKFGLPLLIKTNAYELLVALDMFSEDSSLIRDANMSTNPTISSSGAAKSTDVSRIATVLDSCVVRCAISAGILAEIHNFTSFLRELRSDEDLLFYLHARKVIQRVCNLEPGLRGPSPFRSCQRLPAGLIVFATHPRFSDGSKFPLLSIKAVRAVLREIFRTKTTIDTDLKSVSERERLVSYVVESKVKPHFVHVPGLIATLIARYERETVLFSPVGVSPRGVKEGAERKSRGAFMSRTEVEDIRNDEALWITVPQLLNIMIDDFRNTDYNIVRSLRGEGVDPESEDKCQGLLRINRLVKSQAHDAKREVLIDKLHQERLLLTERESKVQQLRVTAMAAASVQERITCKTALLVAENDCKLQQMAVKEAQLAVNASLTRSDQIWTDVMHQNSQTYRKRRREMRGERRGGVNAATNLTLKRYAVWVETQRVRAKKEARKEKIVQSLVKDHMQQLLDLQVRSAICIQRTYRERLGLRRARNVAFAEITRRRRIRDKRLRQEYEAATTITCARRKQLARRELRWRRKVRQRRERKRAFQKRMAMKSEVRRRFVAHTQRRQKSALCRWSIFVQCARGRRRRRVDFVKSIFGRWRGYAGLRARERSAVVRIQCKSRCLLARKRRHFLQDVEDRFRKHLDSLVRDRFRNWRRAARNEFRLRRFLEAKLRRCKTCLFAQWTLFVRDAHARCNCAAVRIAAVVRGGFVRKRMRRLRASIRLQRWVRTLHEKSVATVAVARKRRNRQTVRAFCSMLLLRHAKRALVSWHAYASRMRSARRMAARNIGRLEHRYFIRWHEKSLVRRRRKVRAVVKVQCAFRGRASRSLFCHLQRQLRAAKTLQRIWRGRNGRLLVARLHSQRNAAITLQSRWRAIKGRERHRVLRVEWVLQSAETSNFEMMLWHLECGRGFVRNGDGTNALMTAAHAASKRIVKLCLRWGFRLEDTDSAGRNVLHYASASFAPGADRLIMYLLLHGARDLLNVKDSEGYTPLASAVRAGTVSCARLLREAGAMLIGPPGTGMNLLHVAVASGRGPMLQMLICNESFYGASAEEALKHANETDLDGLTPTHYACCVGYPKLVRTLADVGVDVDCADQYGRTLLHYAVCSQKALCVEALLAMSANPSHRDADGLSALHHAALNDFGDEIDALCKSERTDVDQCNSNGETALHIAADHGNARAAKELCACAANSGFKNPDGNTPLHIACMNGHDKVVEILLEYAADPNMRNLDGQTPIGFARLGNHGRVVANFKGIFLEQVCEVAPARVEKDSDAWVKRKDELTGETYFYNRETKVEMTDVESLSSMYVKTRTREVKWKPRIVFRPNANQLSKTDYLDYYAKEKRKEVQMAKEKRAAVLFQREYRRSKARWKFRLHQIQTRNAAKLQRKWRQHFATRRVAKMRLKKTAARTIQRNWRAHLLLTCARRDRRHAKLRKRQNEAAEIVQRRWRVKRARRVYVKLKTAWKLSSMTRSDWDKYMDRLTGHDRMPVRSWRAFEEWEAAELGLEEVVHFYRNRINGNCSWEQPATWKREDEKMRREERQRRERGYTDTEVDAARTLQSIWRGKVLREDFASLLKSVRIMRTCERRYLERPNNLIVLCNYMIFVLTIKQDRDKARPLVEEAMKRMIKRGPDTPFILYTYGIFLAATGEEDWDVINNIFERAHAGDNSGNAYKLARKGFYRMATLILKGRERAVAHFQYALCLQFCVRQYASARAHYIKALSLLADDHRSREYARVVDNFNYLMTEIIGADHDGIEEFNRHQEVLAKKKAEEWNARGRFEFYAVKLQSAARVLLAKIATRRIRNSEEYRLRTKMKRISGDRDGGPPSDAIVLRRRRLSSSTSSRVARSNAESGNDDKSFPPGTVDHDDDVESLESLPSGIVDHDVESLESLPSGIVDNDESDDGGGSLPPGIVDSVVNEPPPGLDLFTTSRSDSGAPPGLDDLPPGVDFANSRGRSSIEDDRIPPGTDSHCVGKESESDEDEETERNGVSRWETCIDAESGRVYYYDTLSGKSQWRRPSSFVADILWEEAFDRPSGNRYFVNLSNGDTQWDRPQGVSDEAIRWLEDEEGSVSNGAAGSEWEKVRDDQNRMYWYNVRTNDSVWSLPGRAQVGEHGRCIAAASRGDSTEETEDGTGRWEVCRDASSDRTYYYNRETGVSQWDCPRAVDAENNPSSELSLSDEHPAEVGGEWEICTDESSSNRVYYYNRRTGESQWDMPVCG